MISFKQRTSFLCLVILMGLFFCLFSSAVSADEGFDYVPNEVLVKFKPGIDENQKEAVRSRLGVEKIKEIKSIRVEHWKLPEGLTVNNALELLSETPCVENAEPNYLYKPLSAPNDPQFNQLWFLRNTGQTTNGTAGSSGADISALQAWDIETGSHDIVIAVIDSGVAYEHPDLVNNVWTNVDEIFGNGVDDDSNGYVDDVYGWDFVNDDCNPSDYSKDVYSDGHGTHVAGIIAAQGNNGIGVAGVMWRAQIMPLQIFDLFRTGSFNEAVIQHLRILLAIDYAVDNGAKIINCSFGGGPPTQSMYDILNYAHQNGVLVVISAGNDSNDNDLNPVYPASYDLPNIIAVAATNELDELASYSNYGVQTVDVAAPGGSGTVANIYSTIPPQRELLFYDDFESGASQWLTSGIYEPWSYGYNPIFGSTVIQDSVFSYHENEDSILQTAYPIDASDCRGLHFEYKIYYSLEGGYDYLYFQFSFDNVTYFDFPPGLTGFSNGIIHHRDWSPLDLEIDVPFYLRFRLITDSSINYDGVYFDDFILTGVPWVFDGDEYDYKSGTSMAAPIVSGIAGLIWSENPQLTHLQVKDTILNSVDPLDSLDGKVLTGGRANAYKALLAISPPVAEFSGSSNGGIAPLSVAFSDQSSGEITVWLWDFGDGTNSTAQNPNHTYDSLGTYTVRLTVSGPGGSDTETKIDYITVTYPLPIADAGIEQSVNEGEFVTLNGSNSSGNSISYIWSQTSGPEVIISDPYVAQPTFTACEVNTDGVSLTFKLTVTDTYGRQDEGSCSVNILDTNVSADASGGGGGGCFISAVANNK